MQLASVGRRKTIRSPLWLHYSNDILMSKCPSCISSALVNDEDRKEEHGWYWLLCAYMIVSYCTLEKKIFIFSSTAWSKWILFIHLFKLIQSPLKEERCIILVNYVCVWQCFENICNLFIAESHNSNPGCEIFVHTVTAVLRGYGITRSSMHY